MLIDFFSRLVLAEFLGRNFARLCIKTFARFALAFFVGARWFPGRKWPARIRTVAAGLPGCGWARAIWLSARWVGGRRARARWRDEARPAKMRGCARTIAGSLTGSVATLSGWVSAFLSRRVSTTLSRRVSAFLARRVSATLSGWVSAFLPWRVSPLSWWVSARCSRRIAAAGPLLISAAALGRLHRPWLFCSRSFRHGFFARRFRRGLRRLLRRWRRCRRRRFRLFFCSRGRRCCGRRGILLGCRRSFRSFRFLGLCSFFRFFLLGSRFFHLA